jgi:hypothetical protein
MTAQQTVQHPGTASALAIAGGILMIVSGLLILTISVFVLPAMSSYLANNVHFVTAANGTTTAVIVNGTTHYFNGTNRFNGGFPFQPGMIPGFISGITAVVGTFGLVSGVIVLMSGVMLRTNPSQHSVWGVLILVFSVLSFFGFGGFIIGAILGIIGGIMALTWKPSTTVA